MTKRKTKSDPVDDGKWDVPFHMLAKDLKAGNLIWVAKRYRVIHEIEPREEEEDRLILLEGMTYPILVPNGAVFWTMNELRPGTAEKAVDEQEPLHVKEPAKTEPVKEEEVQA